MRKRMREVFDLTQQGFNEDQIAKKMNLKKSTIKKYLLDIINRARLERSLSEKDAS